MNFNKFLLSHVLCVGVLSMCSFKIYRKSALMPTWLKVMELLNFYDRMMRSWKFRYCYWKSSQSFVFTRGWNKFVKEKYLKANDSISFYLCEFKEVAEDANSFCMIDDFGFMRYEILVLVFCFLFFWCCLLLPLLLLALVVLLILLFFWAWLRAIFSELSSIFRELIIGFLLFFDLS